MCQHFRNYSNDPNYSRDLMYILLSGTLAGVTLAVRGNTRSFIAAVHVRCSMYPNIHPLVWL
jgi:hypothetical protein